MKIVAVVCRKGGVGKTTIATHLAVAAEKLGLVTVVLDLDPQASAASWGDHRGKGSAPAVVAAQATRLPLLLKEAEDQDADLIILDTPPHADAIVASPEGRRRATQFTTARFEHIPAELLAHQIRGAAACPGGFRRGLSWRPPCLSALDRVRA